MSTMLLLLLIRVT
jgi:hypothetical protein